MRNAVIIGSGSFVPEKIVPNSFFNKLLNEDVDTWLKDNLTIEERRWCNENESTADLAYNAAVSAINNANIKVSDIDLIIVATDTPEYISPSTASIIQHRLNAVNCGTFDLNTACAGFVTALDVATKFIRGDENYNHILVVGVYAMSKYLDLTDKKTVTLFADGAGAVVLKSSDSAGYFTSLLHTDGQYADWMGIYAGGTHFPINKELIENKDHLLKFVKKIPKEINPATWSSMITKCCERVKISPTEIDHYFFTQININSIWETLDKLNVPHARAHTIMSKYGYTGSACIPMAFDDARKKNKMKDGEIVCFMGSGGGLAFACSIYKMNFKT